MNKILAAVVFFSVQTEWRVTTSEDEMDNSFSVYAASPEAKSNKDLGWLYSNQEIRLEFNCDGEDEWVYIYSDPHAPSMIADETEDGYSIANLRVKIDEEKSTTRRFIQVWGSKFIFFSDDEWAINTMVNGNTMKVEIPWYGEGDIIFSFDLFGSRSGIEEARQKCLSAQ